jgi:DNA polymerase-3 subunit epsilon
VKNLSLDRPLTCFDLETTGIDCTRDSIVEIGVVRLEPGGTRRSFHSLVNPGRSIPPEATAVHGITDADVADKPRLSELAGEIAALFEDADVAGFNSLAFDWPLLLEEMNRAGQPLDPDGRHHLDAMRIFHLKEKRDLTAAYRFYCDKELVGAHSALVDASATVEILDAQLARYDDLPRELSALHRLCNPDSGRWLDGTRKLAWNRDGEAVFAFGKHKNRTLREIAHHSPDYFDWILQSEFSFEVKQIVARAKDGEFPQRPVEPAPVPEPAGRHVAPAEPPEGPPAAEKPTARPDTLF